MSSHETLGDAWVTIRGDGTRFPADIDATVTGGVTEVVKKGAKILGGLVIAAKLKDQFKEGLAELEESLAVAAQTSAVIASTGGVAGVTAGHVSELAGALLEVSGADDELIAKGENILLSFTSVKNAGEGTAAIFDRATVAGLDLATRGFGSVESNAKLLGLALSDPEVGLTKLRKAGILLTDQQIAAIDAFTQVGDLLGAQGVILDAIEGKVGGAAAAYGETLPGKLKIAQESLTNLKAEIVSSAAPAMELFADTSKSAVDVIQGLPDPVKDVIGGLGLLAFVAGGIVQPLAGVSNILSLLATRRAANAAAAVVETGATVASAVATEAAAVAESQAILAGLGLAEANSAVAASAGAAAAGERAVAAGAGAASIGLAPFLLAAAAVAVVGEAAAQSLHLFGQEGEHLDFSIKGAVPSVQDFSSKLGDIEEAAGLTGRSLADVATLTAEKSVPAARNYNEALRAQGLSTDEVTAAIDKVEAAQRAAEAGARGMTVAEAENADAMDAAGKAADGFAGFMTNLTGAMDASYAASGKWYGLTLTNKDLLVDYEGNVDSLTEALAKNTLTTDIHTEAGRTNYAALRQTGESIVGLIKNHVAEGASLEEAIGWGNQYVENLKAQLREAGYNEQQIADMIAEINLTPADIRTEFSNNAVEQQLVIGEFLAQLDTIKPEYKAQIRAEIAAGEYAKAQADLDALAAGRTIDLHVNAPEIVYHQVDDRGVTYFRPESGGRAYFALGGLVDAPRGQAVPAVVHGGEYVMTADMVDAITRGKGYIPSRSSTAAVGELLSMFKAPPGYTALAEQMKALTATSVARGRSDPFTTSGLAALGLLPGGATSSEAYRTLLAQSRSKYNEMNAVSGAPQVVKQYITNFPTLPADATLTPARVGTVLRRIEALAGG